MSPNKSNGFIAEYVWPQDRNIQRIAIATLANTVGSGLYIPLLAIYLTSVAGFSVAEMGSALLVSGILAVVATFLSGHIIDRIGPKHSYFITLASSSIGMLAVILAKDIVALFIALCFFTVFDRCSAVARSALIGGLAEGAKRVQIRAYLRSVSNAGMAVGASLTAPLFALNNYDVFGWALAANSLSYAISGALILSVKIEKKVTPEKEPSPPARGALHDMKFVGATILFSVLAIHIEVLGFGVPLWISQHSTAPGWSISLVLVINTLLVVLFQVRLSMGTSDQISAARAGRKSGLLILISFIALGLSAALTPTAAVVVLVFFAVTYSACEILFSASAYGISYARASNENHGRYQSLLNTGIAASRAISPSLIGFICLPHGVMGWAALGFVLCAAGVLLPVLMRSPQDMPEAQEQEVIVSSKYS